MLKHSTLDYASCSTRSDATCIVFGADTKCGGTAPMVESVPDHHSQFSPDVIRRIDNTLYSLPENYKTGELLWDDGNLNIESHDKTTEVKAVQQHMADIFRNNQIPICLGGDHLIKYSALAALSEHTPNDFGVVYLDAHPDCEESDILSYASILHHGFLLDGFKPEQVMLLGLRQFTEKEVLGIKKIVDKAGIISGTDCYAYSPKELLNKIIKQFKGKKYLYFSIDLDGLDPAAAPAIESPYPGGPPLNLMIYLIKELANHFQYIGMDISEFIPSLDKNYITALAAARLAKEFYSVI